MSGIQARLAKLEALDVLLMPVSMLDDLQKDGTVLAAGRATLAIIGLGVGVKTGAPIPDIATPDALRRALSAARAVVHAPPTATPSGAQSDKVIRELGLAGKLPVIHKAGLAGGVAAIASGEAEFGIFPKSEIVAFDGVTLIGSLAGGFAAQHRLWRGRHRRQSRSGTCGGVHPVPDRAGKPRGLECLRLRSAG